jgi:hypothetical protein
VAMLPVALGANGLLGLDDSEIAKLAAAGVI